MNGRICVADRGNGRVAAFSGDGVVLRHIGSAVLETPEAVAVNTAEQLFVLDRADDDVVAAVLPGVRHDMTYGR